MPVRHRVPGCGAGRGPDRAGAARLTARRLPACGLVVRGVAWSGAAPIERVEVSVARGPWQKARLAGLAVAHGWQQWEYLATGLRPGEVSLRAQAADLAGHVQANEPEWNRRGYGANVIHEIGSSCAERRPTKRYQRAIDASQRESG